MLRCEWNLAGLCWGIFAFDFWGISTNTKTAYTILAMSVRTNILTQTDVSFNPTVLYSLSSIRDCSKPVSASQAPPADCAGLISVFFYYKEFHAANIRSLYIIEEGFVTTTPRKRLPMLWCPSLGADSFAVLTILTRKCVFGDPTKIYFPPLRIHP